MEISTALWALEKDFCFLTSGIAFVFNSVSFLMKILEELCCTDCVKHHNIARENEQFYV